MRISAFFRNLLRRRRVERELDQEVQAYAAMLADEHTAGGMDAERAHRAALAQMQGVDVPAHARNRRSHGARGQAH